MSPDMPSMLAMFSNQSVNRPFRVFEGLIRCVQSIVHPSPTSTTRNLYPLHFEIEDEESTYRFPSTAQHLAKPAMRKGALHLTLAMLLAQAIRAWLSSSRRKQTV